jgi:hypothetical protein
MTDHTQAPSKERSSIEDIRARAAQPVTEIVANPREYYRVQQLLRDRADLLAYYDELRTPTEQCNCPPGTCVKGTNDDVTCRKDPSTAHEPAVDVRQLNRDLCAKEGHAWGPLAVNVCHRCHEQRLAQPPGDALAAGDVIAHQLMYRDHGEILERWWQARGGHASCTVCNPLTCAECGAIQPYGTQRHKDGCSSLTKGGE